MDAVTAGLELAARRDSTRALLTRLWHEHISHHKARLLLILVLTAIMAGTTALYPVVIDHAFQMFTNRDRRILYQIPALVVAVTSIKAAAQYFQNVQVQQVVLLVIRDLQGRMFSHLTRADLARLEREAPAQLAARFTTDATIIRDALTRAVNGIADAITGGVADVEAVGAGGNVGIGDAHFAAGGGRTGAGDVEQREAGGIVHDDRGAAGT